MKKILFSVPIVIGLLFTPMLVVNAGNGEDVEISLSQCSAKYGEKANSCNQCFESSVYEKSYVGLAENYTNPSSSDRILYKTFDGGGLKISYDPFGNAASFTSYQGTFGLRPENFSDGIFQFDPLVPKNVSATRGEYLIFTPGTTNLRIMQTLPNTGLTLTSLDKTKNPSRGKAEFKVKYNTVTYDTYIAADGKRKLTTGTPNEHNECVFFAPRWCGDGVKDTSLDDADFSTPGIQPEQCDGNDGITPGINTCNNKCQIVTTPEPACISLTPVNTVGEGTFSTTLTCAGSDVPNGSNYEINCGNGTNATMNGDGKSGVCNYVNAGTKTNLSYIAACTIKSGVKTYTSNACTSTITAKVNPNNRFDLSLKKYVDTVDAAHDADTNATAIDKAANTNFTYQIVVRNEGTGAVVGETRVVDTLPANISFASANAVSGAGWVCPQTTNSFTCTRSDSVSAGTAFPTISVSVRVAASVASGTNIRNDATVSNPNETDVISNTNPAVIRVVDLPPPPPQCGSSVGTITAPITATSPNLCTPGNVTSFVAVTAGNTTNYNWSCNNVSGNQSCSANYTVTPPPQGTLSIKKYAGTMPAGDSQSESTAVGVSRGAEFNYIYRVTVSSGAISSGAIVRDALPEYVEFVRFGSTPAGWSTGSTTTTHSGHLHTVVMHQTDSILPSGSTYDFTIVARLRADSVGQYHQNIAYVCPKKILSGGSLIDNPACTTTVPPLPPDTGCSTLPNPPFMDPACIKANDGFDLSIRKYINSDDAETAINLASGDAFNYRMVVTNNGPAAVNGTTFVSDTFPAGVERTSGAITGSGWNCSASSGSTLSCYSTQTVVKDGTFPDIIAPMRVTAGANTTVTNTACVTNANEPITKTFTGGDTTNCNNAVLKTPGCTGSCCSGSCPLPVTCEEVLQHSSTQFSCRGNAQARTFGVDWNNDGIIDYVDTFGGLNIKTFNVPLPGRPVEQVVKCIVSNDPVFPILPGHNYNDEYSSAASRLDTNDASCRLTTSKPFCGNGIVEAGESCDGGSVVNWGSCHRPGTINQCSSDVCVGAGCYVCGNGRLEPGEQCDPSVYSANKEDWGNCGSPSSSAGTVVTKNNFYDPCTGKIIKKTIRTPGACRIGDNSTHPDMTTQPVKCDLPIVTIVPQGSSTEYLLSNGSNVYKGYNIIIGQDTPVFRVGDQLNLRSPGYVFAPDAGDRIHLKSHGSFITDASWSRPIDTQACIGNAQLGDQPNRANSMWNGTTNSWELCKPLEDFSKFNANNSNKADASLHKGLVYNQWPGFPSSDQWNGSVGSSSVPDYGQTNNQKHATVRGFGGKIPYDFYATILHGWQDVNTDMNLPATINIRVTRPIIANNAGGAGYFSTPTSGPDTYVSIDKVTQSFLEQLKAANFNTGKAQNTSVSSSNFDLSSITGPVVFGTDTTLPTTGNNVALVSRKSITLNSLPSGTINSKRTYVINGLLTINTNIDASDKSVAFIADTIKIGSGVTRLDGIYIANKIEGVSGGSQLIVNGSLYGQAADLIAARTYARGSSASSGIVTGILVNYSSRVLSDPPPLVSDFLKQYNLTKVTSVQ